MQKGNDMDCDNLKSSADFIAILRDQQIPVKINGSDELYLVNSFSVNEPDSTGAIIATCGDEIALFPVNEELSISIEE